MISYVEDELYYYRQREGSTMTRLFDVKCLDYGDALIDRYYFTKKNKNKLWRDATACKLSYELEKWSLYAKDNIEIKKKYDELRRRSWFLIFEKNAWGSASVRGKIKRRIKLIMPGVAEFLRKLYNK